MRFLSVVRSRRPSAAMVVACIALFVSLSGAGYAASGLVHTRQIARRAITSSRIATHAVIGRTVEPGSIGAGQANLAQLQARVAGVCPTGEGVGAIASTGAVSCNPDAPAASGFSSSTLLDPEVDISNGAAEVASENLAPGGYFVSADVRVRAVSTSTPQNIIVSCGFANIVRGGGGELTLRTDGVAGDQVYGEMPVQGLSDASPQLNCSAQLADGGTLAQVYAENSSFIDIATS